MTTNTITIKIEAPELASAIHALAAAFAGGSVARAVADATLPLEPDEPEKPKRAPRAAKTSEQQPPESTSSEAPEPTPSSPDAASTTEPDEPGGASLDYDQVRDKVLELTAKRGREATVNLLAQFDGWNAAKGTSSGEPAATGKELNPEDWAEFIAKAAALIEGELA